MWHGNEILQQKRILRNWLVNLFCGMITLVLDMNINEKSLRAEITATWLGMTQNYITKSAEYISK